MDFSPPERSDRGGRGGFPSLKAKNPQGERSTPAALENLLAEEIDDRGRQKQSNDEQCSDAQKKTKAVM
jgi:hypothetical protein